jgi:ribosomal protein S18 acetylase RimI-like enzyme
MMTKSPGLHQQYKLRLAVAADAPELAAFERHAFRTYYAAHRFSQEQFARHLGQSQTIAYVITDRGRIIGYALGVLIFRRPPIARLVSLAVHADYRGQGIGNALLRRFLATTRRRGAHAVYLETAEPNTAALALFGRNGFVPVRRLPRYYTERVDGIRMRREW